MEGLEISEIPLRNVNLGDRSDAEFFSKENLAIQCSLEQHAAIKLGELGEITASAFYPAATELYEEGDVPFARCVDCVNYPVVSIRQVEEFERIPRWFLEQSGQIRTVKRGEIIITKVGTPCYASVVHDFDEVALSRTVLGINDVRGVDPYYLVAFLRSRYGFNQLQRQRELTIQYQLTLERVREVLVFVPREDVQKAISQTLKSHHEAFELADRQLAAAEQTLLHALGLDAWQPPEPLTYVRRASEALTAVRLDAEHFKPKFDDLIAHLMSGGDAVRLDQVLSFCERGRQPAYADKGVIVVNSRHVRTDAVILDGENRFATVEDETLLIRDGDILLNGTGVGTIGRVTTYLHDTPALPDNHVTILRLHPESGFDPVFLAVQLAGIVGQTQVEQHTRGSSGQLELYPQDIRRILVWRAPKEMQLAVRKNIEAAHAARREAQALLARAQRAVEVAIEQGEPAALALLSAKIS